ncbi:phospho-sugar mutase [Radiobacillus deserti]|uniref:Phosphoglucomutase n=1 Tax=Radiobacillus deserti TaxID=2594883 RepID=A0A516KJZ9_9BACI|nr:phospho-sugar mutase [Radiobacillus deserti]QDP41715.1 phospho-sugar mutase [Radiobacillus deserti]
MTWQDTYQKWVSYESLEEHLKLQLAEMKKSEEAIEDAFYKDLTFGTGGMRGMLGPGTNRMNIYTIRKAVEGLANYLIKHTTNPQGKGVAVSYDSRYMSKEFAIETAKVLGKHGIKSYVFSNLHPTPSLSYAVRHLGAAAGVMITASHNPPEYNGFKVYNEDGGQMPPAQAEQLIKEVNAVENELTIPYLPEHVLKEQGLLHWIGEEVDHAYLELVKRLSRWTTSEIEQPKELNIVFTPLHGTSHDLVLKGLRQIGFDAIHVVQEQAKPDPDFSTVDSPNPEEHQAFTMAMEQGLIYGADVLIGTDPDADRLGVAVKDSNGSYQVLTGNQLGILMLDYILAHSTEEDRKKGRLIKTIVTTEMGQAVASHYGVETINTLTGFKFIGEKIKQFESTGEKFLFGFEESYGYLAGDFVRDKDAVQAAVIACELAEYWKRKGKTLLEALEELYELHGYYLEDMLSLTLKGKDGAERIAKIMEHIRLAPFNEIAGLPVTLMEDYQSLERINMKSGTKETIQLPQENVLKFYLDKNSWVALRPSGTEPKVKYYFGVSSHSRIESERLLEQLKAEVNHRVHTILES